jgi:cyclic-di-GMP-binding protein
VNPAIVVKVVSQKLRSRGTTFQNNLTFGTITKLQTVNYKLTMPTFDIVSKVDAQSLDNAVNVTTKEITNRFDFKGSHVVINLNKKEFTLAIETEDEMKMRQLIDVLISRAHKHGIAPEAFDFSKEGYQSGKIWKKEVTVRNGLKQEDAKKIVKNIKDTGLKVQASIMDDLVRVTGKKIDDLQTVIQTSKDWNLGIPLQYENMRN